MEASMCSLCVCIIFAVVFCLCLCRFRCRRQTWWFTLKLRKANRFVICTFIYREGECAARFAEKNFWRWRHFFHTNFACYKCVCGQMSFRRVFDRHLLEENLKSFGFISIYVSLRLDSNVHSIRAVDFSCLFHLLPVTVHIYLPMRDKTEFSHFISTRQDGCFSVTSVSSKNIDRFSKNKRKKPSEQMLEKKITINKD